MKPYGQIAFFFFKSGNKRRNPISNVELQDDCCFYFCFYMICCCLLIVSSWLNDDKPMNRKCKKRTRKLINSLFSFVRRKEKYLKMAKIIRFYLIGRCSTNHNSQRKRTSFHLNPMWCVWSTSTFPPLLSDDRLILLRNDHGFDSINDAYSFRVIYSTPYFLIYECKNYRKLSRFACFKEFLMHFKFSSRQFSFKHEIKIQG